MTVARRPRAPHDPHSAYEYRCRICGATPGERCISVRSKHRTLKLTAHIVRKKERLL